MFRHILTRVAVAALAAGAALGFASPSSAAPPAHHVGGSYQHGGARPGMVGGVRPGSIGGQYRGHAHAGNVGSYYHGGYARPGNVGGYAHAGNVGSHYHGAYAHTGNVGSYHGGYAHTGNVGSYYHGGYAHNGGYAHAGSVGSYYYGGHRYPATGYYGGYRGYSSGYRGYYGGYGYYPRSGFGLGIAIGSLGLGYPYYSSYYSGYPYYGSSYTGYPYYDSSYSSYPDYGSYSGTAVYAPTYAGTDVSTYVPPTTSLYPPAEAAPVPAAAGNTARIEVQVPVGAQVWIDGQLSNQTSTVRAFETPATLEPGRTYSYKVVAQWDENGVPVTRERVVDFQAGNQVIVNMTQP